MAQKKASLKVLAAHLGLTVSTVSRALNGYSDINEQTRARVKRAADELGYRPNQTARRLSLGAPETICYLMPHDANVLAQPFVAQLLQGLSDVLTKRNWDLLIGNAESYKDELSLIDRLVKSGRVGGFVVSRPLVNDPRIRLMQDLKCPFVVHGRTGSCADYAWYDVDGEAAVVTAVDHLVELGHEKIAFIGAPNQYQFSQDRLCGYQRALVENGLSEVPGYVQTADFSDEGGEVAAGMLLDLPEPPTAIICATDSMAFGALAALRSQGFAPGEDVSVIGYDGLSFGAHTNPPLTTMVQPQAHAGRRLGDMLLSVIDGEDPKKHQELQKAYLVQRKSDGPLRRKEVKPTVSVREETHET